MPKILVTLVAAVAIAAAGLPATAGAAPGRLTLDASAHGDVALRPTAVEYAVIL